MSLSNFHYLKFTQETHYIPNKSINIKINDYNFITIYFNIN